eukprot:2286881-Rhodomonas_salina.2
MLQWCRLHVRHLKMTAAVWAGDVAVVSLLERDGLQPSDRRLEHGPRGVDAVLLPRRHKL